MLRLYRRESCELCEIAERLLQDAQCPYEPVWIDGDEALEISHGDRIPVLQGENGKELNWPFDSVALRSLVACT